VLAGTAFSLLVGCRQLLGIDPPVDVVTDAPLTDARSDAPFPDAGPCTAVSVECADANTLRTCAVIGQQPVDTTCSWGCGGPDAFDGSAHCELLVPTGSAALPTDLLGSGLGSATLNATTIHLDTGQINNIRAAGTGIVDGIDFEVRSGVSVFRFGGLAIEGTIEFTVTTGAPPPVVLASTTTLSIDGLIDMQGGCDAGRGGPGGFPGANGGTSAAGSGGGTGSTQEESGGGGGGYGAVGGNGGGGGTSGGPTGGHGFGSAAITLLVGGGGGGGGNGGNPFGGGGGGAIQLIANEGLTIASVGAINAGGCGGVSGVAATDSGGGGGAGGAILIEAHDITITGELAVNGGGGGGNDSNVNGCSASGANGVLGRTTAQGAQNCSANGGAGGATSVLAGSPGQAANGRAGGGGGAVGWIRFNTRSGFASVDNTQLSPSLVDSPTTCTQGVAGTE
jgi:hypothetical protein